MTLLERLREAGDGWHHQDRDHHGRWSRMNLDAAPEDLHEDHDKGARALMQQLRAFNQRSRELGQKSTATSRRLAGHMRDQITSDMVAGTLSRTSPRPGADDWEDLIAGARSRAGLSTRQPGAAGHGRFTTPVDLAAKEETRRWLRTARLPEPGPRTAETRARAEKAKAALVAAANAGHFDSGSHISGNRRRALPTSFADAASRSTSRRHALASIRPAAADSEPRLTPDDVPVVDEVDEWLRAGMPGAAGLNRDLPADDLARQVRAGLIDPKILPRRQLDTLPAELRRRATREALRTLLAPRRALTTTIEGDR